MIYKGLNIENPSKYILKDAKPTMAADDFGFFSEKIPTVYYIVGTGDKAPNHSSKFYVNEDYIKLCTRTMVLAAIDYLN